MNATSLNPHFDDFIALCNQFDQYHQNQLNVFLHLVTTPLGIIGFLGLFLSVTKSTSAVVTLCLSYFLSLLTSIPIGLFFATTVSCGLCVAAAKYLKLNALGSICLIALSYILQDFAHWITNEPTFQGSYSGSNGHIDFTNLSVWSELFIEHAFFLLPLVCHLLFRFIALPDLLGLLKSPIPPSVTPLEASAGFLVSFLFWSIGNYCIDSKNGYCCFPGSPYFSRVLHCNIASDPKKDSESRKSDLATVRNWTLEKMPPSASSSHWWFSELSEAPHAAFDRVARSSHIIRTFRTLFSEQHYCLDVIEGMNEVYVTGPPRFDETFNSDQIFYTKHVDGPYGLIPFVSVFRCIVGTDRNTMITTHFPMSNKSKNAMEGDVLIFDYNREVHNITNDESKRADSDAYRVVLKLHYCVYPRILYPLGKLMYFLNVRYNIAFRALFLKTISPKTAWERFLAWNVVVNTSLFNNIETYIGQRNVIYLAFSYTLWHCTGCYDWFLFATSFVHYLRYIGTYFYRKDIDFGSFQRDVLLFKSIALIQIFYVYFFPDNSTFVFDPISVAMIVVGYAISIKATQALGVERTYFGAELGICQPKWITEFPYGYIPHPMIVSQVVALLGVLKAEHFRKASPFLIHIHVCLYLVHMLQEHFDLHLETVRKYFIDTSIDGFLSNTFRSKKTL